jgi:adenylate cyclase
LLNESEVANVSENDDQSWVRAQYERIASTGSKPEDSTGARARNRALTLSAAVGALVVSPWPVFYFAIGIPQAAILPLFYVIMTVIGGVHFSRTHSATFFRNSQIVMFSLLPLLVHIALGGFINSSVVVIYSLGGAVQALSYVGARKGKWWFGVFCGVIVTATLIDSTVSQNPPYVPPWAITTFFAVNLIAAGAIAVITLSIYVRSRDVLAHELQDERDRSDGLLLNVLPQSIADRLKDGEAPIADHHDDVAVLFADIVGFTALSASLEPDDLVVTLNQIFGAFDAVSAEFGLEKIKTIGDAYMVVAGAPSHVADGPQRIANAALAMRKAAGTFSIDGENPIRMRFGIDVGPAVAGVIGATKFTYDLYGDTINTASRMESTGRPDEIQVSKRAMERLDGTHTFGDSLIIDIKGLGLTHTYFLTGRT